MRSLMTCDVKESSFALVFPSLDIKKTRIKKLQSSLLDYYTQNIVFLFSFNDDSKSTPLITDIHDNSEIS